MRPPDAPHTLEAIVERWSYEARRLEVQAKLMTAPDAREATTLAAVYRDCAADLRRVMREYDEDGEDGEVTP